MFKHLRVPLLALALTGVLPAIAAASCGQRDLVVERLQSKYSEQLAVGGLQQLRETQAVMEIWASLETGTFTVLLTKPDGISCIVAAGTDFFETDRVPLVKGTAS